MPQEYSMERKQMVERQLKRRDIHDPLVLRAMETVPREAFIPENMHTFAYEDRPLPIGEDQTISQPYIVALMTQALELTPKDRALDIGTGSGYAAAILSRIAEKVYSVERYKSLADTAKELFARLCYDNIWILEGDGTLGWPEHAPYDAIVVTAGGPDVPQALLDQLVVGGRLLIPVGKTLQLQELVRVRRTGQDEFEREKLTDVRFVPLIGEQGWEENAQR